MQKRLTIVTLGVHDLRRSRDFYERGLGWAPVAQPSDEIVFIQMPGMVLGLYPRSDLAEDIGRPLGEGPTTGSVTLAYNTASEAETDDVIALAVGAGATLVKAPEKVFWGGYSGYFADPDGHLWEVAYNPHTVPGDDGSYVM